MIYQPQKCTWLMPQKQHINPHPWPAVCRRKHIRRHYVAWRVVLREEIGNIYPWNDARTSAISFSGFTVDIGSASEKALLCNAFSHLLSPYPEWSLPFQRYNDTYPVCCSILEFSPAYFPLASLISPNIAFYERPIDLRAWAASLINNVIINAIMLHRPSTLPLSVITCWFKSWFGVQFWSLQ